MTKNTNLTSVYPVLRLLLADFIKEYTVRDNNGWKSKALRKKYLFSETDTEGVPQDKDLAKILDVTNESVRNIKKLAVEFCSGLHARNEEHFAQFEGIKPVEVKGILMKRFGFGNDEKTLRFYLDGMGYTVTEQKNLGCYCVDTRYYGKGLTSVLRDVIPQVKDLLTSNPVPRRLEDIMDSFKSGEHDLVSFSFARDYILGDSDTFEVVDKNGDKYVSVRWDALPSVAAREVRILYDFALQKGYETFMTKKQLIAEYNTRTYLYDTVDKIGENLSVTQNAHIEFGGNGTYRYLGNPDSKQPISELKKELLRYLASHEGLASFSDLRDYVNERGWKYSDVTIKKYLADDCVVAWKRGEGKRSYYVLKALLPEYQEKGYYHPNLQYSPGKEHGKQQPTYMEAIASRAVNLLKAAPGYTLKQKELFDAVVELYPGTSKNNVYKILAGIPALSKVCKGKGSSYTLATIPGEEMR